MCLFSFRNHPGAAVGYGLWTALSTQWAGGCVWPDWASGGPGCPGPDGLQALLTCCHAAWFPAQVGPTWCQTAHHAGGMPLTPGALESTELTCGQLAGPSLSSLSWLHPISRCGRGADLTVANRRGGTSAGGSPGQLSPYPVGCARLGDRLPHSWDCESCSVVSSELFSPSVQIRPHRQSLKGSRAQQAAPQLGSPPACVVWIHQED